MDTGVLIVVILNLIAVAFSYGKLTQKVKDTNRRIDNEIMHRFDSIDKRLDRIEGILLKGNPDEKLQ